MHGPLYLNWDYAKGQILCKTMGSTVNNTGGKDEVQIGNPLAHTHIDTKAETLTGPLSRNFGGGQLIGDFTVGSKDLLTQDKLYGPTSESKVSPLEHVVQETETLTYPLWGQNVLDWRNPKKEHNNVPPCLNIYVRYLKTAPATRSSLSYDSCERMLKGMAEIREALQSRSATVKKSAAEAQYDSKMVMELDPYVEENLTPHDYILRMALDD